MNDPYLVALLRTVEGGAESPPLWMTLHSGDRVTGTPRPSRQFVVGTYQALLLQQEQSKEVRTAKPEERGAILEAAAIQGISSFNVHVDASGGETMTLEDVTVLFGGRDDGLRLPVVRVQLSAVNLWWVAGGKEVSGGGSYFVGLAVPTG